MEPALTLQELEGAQCSLADKEELNERNVYNVKPTMILTQLVVLILWVFLKPMLG